MIRALALVLALVLSGCMAEPFALEIDPAFSPRRRAAIEAAAMEWLYAGASLGRIRVVQGKPSRETWAAEHRPGTFIDPTGTITIRPEVSERNFYMIALHEFGHAAAGTHRHHEGRGVMRRHVSQMTPCITPDDMRFAGLDGPGTCDTPAEPQR